MTTTPDRDWGAQDPYAGAALPGAPKWLPHAADAVREGVAAAVAARTARAGAGGEPGAGAPAAGQPTGEPVGPRVGPPYGPPARPPYGPPESPSLGPRSEGPRSDARRPAETEESPEPAPDRASQPEREPESAPTPEPIPEPTPAPMPEPIPAPTPEPTPAPAPAVTPKPTREPAPAATESSPPVEAEAPPPRTGERHTTAAARPAPTGSAAFIRPVVPIAPPPRAPREEAATGFHSAVVPEELPADALPVGMVPLAKPHTRPSRAPVPGPPAAEVPVAAGPAPRRSGPPPPTDFGPDEWEIVPLAIPDPDDPEWEDADSASESGVPSRDEPEYAYPEEDEEPDAPAAPQWALPTEQAPLPGQHWFDDDTRRRPPLVFFAAGGALVVLIAVIVVILTAGGKKGQDDKAGDRPPGSGAASLASPQPLPTGAVGARPAPVEQLPSLRPQAVEVAVFEGQLKVSWDPPVSAQQVSGYFVVTQTREGSVEERRLVEPGSALSEVFDGDDLCAVVTTVVSTDQGLQLARGELVCPKVVDTKTS